MVVIEDPAFSSGVADPALPRKAPSALPRPAEVAFQLVRIEEPTLRSVPLWVAGRPALPVVQAMTQQHPKFARSISSQASHMGSHLIARMMGGRQLNSSAPTLLHSRAEWSR